MIPTSLTRKSKLRLIPPWSTFSLLANFSPISAAICLLLKIFCQGNTFFYLKSIFETPNQNRPTINWKKKIVLLWKYIIILLVKQQREMVKNWRNIFIDTMAHRHKIFHSKCSFEIILEKKLQHFSLLDLFFLRFWRKIY